MVLFCVIILSSSITLLHLIMLIQSRHPFTSHQLLTSSQFVQSLASPLYLNHLASLKYLENPAFIAYLDYLQYWSHRPYTKYLTYPGPTLKNLQLLQQDKFRTDILSPDVVARLMEEGIKKGLEGPGS